jgi:hypothetical protein
MADEATLDAARFLEYRQAGPEVETARTLLP